MSTPKIFISTVPFGEVDKKPIQLLNETGWEYSINPTGRKLTGDEVAQLANNYDGIIAGTEDLTSLIETSGRLKIISRVGIGLDSVPLLKCKDHGIIVTYTPDAVTMAVAELTIGVMVTLTRHVHRSDMEIRRGVWQRKQGKRIGESVIGLIGLGRIGSNVLKLLSSFKPRAILVNDILDKSQEVESYKNTYGLDIQIATKERVLQQSDIVSLHVPLSAKTKNLIDAAALSAMKPDAFLINYARGGIINEYDLYNGLKRNLIAGAAIDCFESEPYYGPLTELDNILLTQHMGSCSFDCRARMEIEATQDMVRFFNHETLNGQVPVEEMLYQL